LWQPAQGYGTALELVLGKWTSATNSSSSCKRLCSGVEIVAHCDYCL